MASADSSYFSVGPAAPAASDEAPLAPAERVSMVERLRRRKTDLVDQRRKGIEDAKDVRAQIDYILSHMPRRPDASVEGYERMLEDMEAERSTTTMSLNAEKSLLREMEQIRARMRMVSEYEAADGEIKRLRTVRDGISTRLDSLSAELDACSASLAVAQVLDRLMELRGDISGITAEDIVTIKVPIDAAAAPRIIGTKGETRRSLEKRFAVIIDVDGGPGSRRDKDKSRGAGRDRSSRRGGAGRGGDAAASTPAPAPSPEPSEPCVTIRGLAASVKEAREHIVDLCGTDSATVSISRGVQNMLLADSAKTLRQLQDEHVVHMNIDRPGRRGARGGRSGAKTDDAASGGASATSSAPASDSATIEATVVIEGSKRRVKQCEAALASLERTKQRIPLTTDQLIDIIGPGGERVRELQSTHGVFIETVRPTLEEASKGISASSIDVYGADAASVVRAAAAVRDLAEELKRIEQDLRLESSFALFLLGNSAARLSKLRKTVQCQIDIGARVLASTLDRARELLAAGEDEDADAEDEDGKDADAAALFLPPDSDGVRATSRVFTVRARRDDLGTAVAALKALYDEFQAQRRRLIVPAAAARALVRNGAAGIKKLRSEAPPGVMIMVDIDEDSSRAGSSRGGGRGRGGGSSRRGRVDADEFVLPPAGKAVVTIRMESGGKGGKKGKAAAAKKAAAAAAAAGPEPAADSTEPTDAPAPAVDTRPAAEKMDEAVELVRSAVASFTEQTVEVADFAVPAILGKGGATINKLQSDSGASVTLERGPILSGSAPAAVAKPAAASGAAAGAGGRGGRSGGGGGRAPRPDRGPSTLHISGLESDVAKAVAAIEAIMEKHQSAEVEGADDGGVRAAIIGERGANIRAIEASCGAKIDLNKAKGVFIAIGKREQVDKAAEELRAAIEKHHKTNASLNVGPDMALSVIGKGGEAVRAMEAEFKVRIRVDQHSGEISIRADDEETLAAAVARIREQTGMDKPFVEVPYERSKQDNVLPLVFGRQGASLRRLQDEHGVIIAVDRKRCVLLVRGDEPNIEAAAASLRATVKEGSKTVIELYVPASAVPGIIGRRGASIRMLERLTRADIDLRKGAAVAGATVSGRPVANSGRQSGRRGRRGQPGSGSGAGAGGARGGGAGGAAKASRDPTDAKITIRGGTAACKAAQAAVRAVATGKGYAILPLLPLMAASLLGEERSLLDRLVASGTTITLKGYVRSKRAATIVSPATSSLASSLWAAQSTKAGETGETAAAAAASAADAESAAKKEDKEEKEDEDEDEEAGVASKRTVALVLVAATEDAVRESQAAVEFTLGHRFTGQLARVPAPHGLLGALVDSVPPPQTRASRAAAAAAAAATAKAAAAEDDAEPPAKKAAPMSVESLRTEHGVHAVWTNTLTGHVLLCGDEAAVSSAREVLEEAVTAFASLRGSVRVPDAIVPAIVGRAGARITELEAETKCKLQMIRARDARAAGDAEVVAAGKDGFALLRVTSPDSETTLEGIATLKAEVERLSALRKAVRVPSGAVGIVLGRKGETIQAISAESGARLRFNDERTAVNVSGDTAEQVEDAVRLLRKAMTDSGVDPDQEEVPVDEVVIETSRNGAIAVIGRGGATVTRIQGEHRGVRVDIQADDGLVYLRGPKNLLEAAEATVREVIAAAEAEADERRERRDAERASESESKGGDDESSARGAQRGRGRGGGAGRGGDSSSGSGREGERAFDEPEPASAPAAPHVPLGLGAGWQEQMKARQIAQNRARNSTRGAAGGSGHGGSGSRTAPRPAGRKGKGAADLEAAAEAEAVAAKAARDAAAKPSAARKTAADEMLSMLTTPTEPAPSAAPPSARRAPPPGLGFSPQPKKPTASRTAAPSAAPPAAADDPFALLGLSAPATAAPRRTTQAGAGQSNPEEDGSNNDGATASYASMLSGGGITIRL